MNLQEKRIRLKWTLLFIVLGTLSVSLSIATAALISSVILEFVAAMVFILLSASLFYYFFTYPLIEKYEHAGQYTSNSNDHTERNTYEQLVKESEQRYKSLFENNPDIVCSFDSTGRMIRANPAVEKITGYTIEEVVGKPYQEIMVNDLSGLLGEHIKFVFQGESRTGEVSIQHKDGHLIELEVIMVPIHVGEEVGGFYVIAKDLTDYRQAQEMLRKTEKLNVVGELAAGIAHEIRNPLTSLKGFIQLLQPSLTSKQEYAEVMLSELNRIEQIVSELLLLAKPKSAEFQEGDLKTLLEHVRTLLNTKAIMSNTDIILNYHADTSRIYCEENQLKQVFINLVKNAIEAMPSGGEIHIEAEEVNSEHVLVRIIDEGEGIPEEHLKRLGEPFYTTKEQGTGLGLMISSNIIKDHSGTILFKNNEEAGATVEVTLPIAVDAHCQRKDSKSKAVG